MQVLTIRELSDAPGNLAAFESVCVVASQHKHIRAFLTNDECAELAEQFLEWCQSSLLDGVVVRTGFTAFVIATMQPVEELNKFIADVLNKICEGNSSRRAWFFESTRIVVESEGQVVQVLNELDSHVFVMAQAEFGYAFGGKLK